MGAQPISDVDFVQYAAPEAPPPPNSISLGGVKARYAVLERAHAFFGLSDQNLRVLARRARQALVARDTVLFAQGEEGDSMYAIVSGWCEVSVSESAGHLTSIAMLGPGDAFGEEAVLDRQRPVSVRAIDECELLILDRDAVRAVAPPGSEVFERMVAVSDQRQSTLHMLIERSKIVSPTHSAVSLAIYSPKGGAGRTTIALNVAAQLASRYPGEVCLVDMALPYNHAALMTNLIPTSSLAQLADLPPTHFEEALLSIVLHHRSGFMVLPTAMRPEEAELVTPDLIDRGLEVLNRSFRYLIFDLGQHMSDAVITVLERVSRILVLATPELTAIKDIADLQRIFTNVLDIHPERVMLAINFRSPRGLIDTGEVARQLNQPIVCEFQYEGSRVEELAIRQGEILSVTDPRSTMARGTAKIAEILGGANVGGEPKPGRRLLGFG